MSAESNPSDRKHGDSARPSESRPIERSGAAGAARLRDRIDRGAGGDKVAFQDPAAAPLGTDDDLRCGCERGLPRDWIANPVRSRTILSLKSAIQSDPEELQMSSRCSRFLKFF